MDSGMQLKMPMEELDNDSTGRDLLMHVRRLSIKIDALTEAFQASQQSNGVEVVDERTGASSFVPKPRALAHVDTSDWKRRLERTATGLALHTWSHDSVSNADDIRLDFNSGDAMERI